MATVIAEMSMSLDGFVADPSDQVGPLFDWYGNGEVEVPTAVPERWTFRTSVALEGPRVIEGTGVTHLSYRVKSR